MLPGRLPAKPFISGAFDESPGDNGRVNGKWRQNSLHHHKLLPATPWLWTLVVVPDEISAVLDGNRWHALGIINSHGHYDHVGAAAPLMDRYYMPEYLHGADLAPTKTRQSIPHAA